MLARFSRVGFCGSRSLPASALPLVSSVVSTALSGSSASLAVGCSVGADALVLSSVPRGSLRRVSVFAAFGRGGVGSCSLSAVPSVVAALRGGASVRWWAGGGAAVPLRVRLASRSVALVRFLAGAQSSALVCFLSSPRSRGSLLACRLAARLGVSVFVFCVGFSPSRLPRLGPGAWVPVSFAASPAARWVPAEKFIPSPKDKETILEWITSSIRKTCFVVMLLALTGSNSYASVPQAIANAQQGLWEALKFEMPTERKLRRIEKRNDGVLIYKLIIKRLSEHSFKIRVTGFDEGDEVIIVTVKIENDTHRQLSDGNENRLVHLD